MHALISKLDEVFDPTDSNAASDVAEAAIRLMIVAARALRDDQDGMRMGRENATEMGVRLGELGGAMRLIPKRYSGADLSGLWEELLK